VSRVTLDDSGRYHRYLNGTTLHGSQALDPEQSREATTYFYRTGPLGQFFSLLDSSNIPFRVGIIGLGVGQISTYAQAGQQWTYYEIDPTVERIARDTRYFTYLKECRADLRIVLGDGRLKLSDAPDGFYNVLILDAYSSDSVPVHLITRQALKLYLSKLKPNGKIVFHISNRYLDLEPVLGNLAGDAGLFAFCQHDTSVSPDEGRKGKTASTYVIMSRARTDLESIARDSRWKPIRKRPDLGVWTDDFSSILRVVNWQMPDFDSNRFKR